MPGLSVRCLVLSVAAAVLASGWIAVGAVPASAAGLVVNSLADTNDGHCDTAPDCTLREAILAANATAAKDTITFSVGSGTPSIAVGSSGLGALPAVTEPVAIQGNTGGATRIELNGSGAGSGVAGLRLSAGKTTVARLVINRFKGDAVDIDTAGGNTIRGSFLGTDASGATASANTGLGVRIAGEPGNVIGGSTSGARNVISGNGNVGVAVDGGNGNIIEGNFIGTNAAGDQAVPNHTAGVEIIGSLSSVVGGSAPGAGNVISGNQGDGVQLNDVCCPGSTSGNLVQGNLIGTDATGTSAIPNQGDGVLFQGLPDNNTVGGTIAGARNVISGNTGDGIEIAVVPFSANETIQGNFIGTDAAGTSALPNQGAGVHINDARNNVIGGATAGSANLISGNNGDGILIDTSGTGDRHARDNIIQGNLIGTDAAGTAPLGNDIGIHTEFEPGNTIGGTAGRAGNVISGNAIGIDVHGGSDAQILGNLVGTDPAGTGRVPNQADGVLLDGTFQFTLGGTAAGAGNVIAFNGPSIVKGNGVLVTNGANGSILGNSIFANSLLGIDLGDDGVTANDAGDADTGPNGLQNFPAVSKATSGGSVTHVSGKLSSSPSARYVVELFTSPVCDRSGHGEGKQLLGRTSVTTNTSGIATFDVTFPRATTVGRVVTATATDPGGSTSEFSSCRKVVSGP